MPAKAPRAAPTWLMVVAGVVMVAGAAVAVLGLASSAQAHDDRAEAQAQAETERGLVGEAEQELASLQLESQTAQAELEEAQAAVGQAETVQNGMTADLASAQELLLQTNSEIPGRQAEARAFVDAAGPVIDIGSACLATGLRILDLRAEQEARALDGDYRGFNRLQGDYNGLTEAANLEMDAFAGAVTALPSLTGVGALTALAGEPLAASDVNLNPPTGRARVTAATTSDPIPCTSFSTNGCRYNWKVTFTETAWLGVTIERIAIRYDERGGRAYWYSESGEWRDVNVVIPAGGTASYDGGVQTTDDSDMRLIMGGRLKLRYQGTDADGNSISGSASAQLERPEG